MGARVPRGAPRAFHLLAKPTGAVCNLDCTYCFFLSKEMLYPGSRFRMADDLLEAYLRQLFEAHAHAPEVVVAWQGGEPTMMGLGFFRRSVELAEGMKRPGQRICYTIQTNGTLLDDEWAAFFAGHGFLVGLSVDGPRDIHDTYRVDKGGKGSFDRVMAGLAALQRHSVEWNALTTVHAANQDRGREVYAFSRDQCGARFMQFIPHHRAGNRADAGGRQRRLGRAGTRPAAVPPARKPGHQPLGHPGRLRPVPHRHLRGLGPRRHRRGLRADVRRRAG
jgi:uncharacterized protein